MQLLADKYYIDDVSVRVLPLSIKKDAYGVIFVGASMRPIGSKEGNHVGDSHHASVHIEHGMAYEEDGEKVHNDMKSQASLEHFNIYALDAKDGHVIWRHDGFGMPLLFLSPTSTLHHRRPWYLIRSPMSSSTSLPS